MGWRDLLSDERFVAPWVGGRSLQTVDRLFKLTRLPPEPGWHRFEPKGRKAAWVAAADPEPEQLKGVMMGYLIGDRFIDDNVKVDLDPAALVKNTLEVRLVEPGIRLFSRVSVGRVHDAAPLVFRSQEFPLGPEAEVFRAFEDGLEHFTHITNLPPALDVAYQFERHRLKEIERRRREEQERREREERQRRIREQLGDGELRRQMAAEDFGEAAKAALAVGGAEYIGHSRAYRHGEMEVRFRFAGRRFECVCNEQTLGIIDSGICLTAHYDDPDFAGGTKGDTFLTLESLPAVIQQAIDEDRLVVWRDA